MADRWNLDVVPGPNFPACIIPKNTVANGAIRAYEDVPPAIKSPIARETTIHNFYASTSRPNSATSKLVGTGIYNNVSKKTTVRNDATTTERNIYASAIITGVPGNNAIGNLYQSIVVCNS